MKKLLVLLFLGLILTFAVSAVTLDGSIDSAEEFVLLMNTPSAWNGEYTLSCDIDLGSLAG